MPHDKKGQLLQVGDKVNLAGTIQAITSEQPTYCNITLLTDEGMAPETPGYTLALSARMVEKVDQ